MQFVCLGGMLTYVAFSVVDLSKIHVITKEEKSKLPPPKKPKKNFDISQKCQDVWASQFPWVEILKNETREVHQMKCLVRSFVKNKDVILGPKADTLEKHVGKTKVVQNMPHLGKKQGEWYGNKKCNQAKNEIAYS